MPFLFQVHDKSGHLSHSRFFDDNPQKLPLSDLMQKTIHHLRKETHSLTERERAWNIPSLEREERTGQLQQSESPCQMMSASLTIEASLCLTLFLVFMISLCQLFLVMQLQLRMQKALEQVGSEVAQYSYLNSQMRLWESDSLLLRQVEEYLLAEVSQEAIRLRFLELIGPEVMERSVLAGGATEISFEESRLMKENHRLRLVVSYPIQLPMRLLGMGNITLRQQCYRYALMGDVAPTKKVETQGKMVYVTKNRQVYHLTLSCTYLNLSIRSVSMSQVAGLRNDSGGKYYPCERCEPTGRESAVYLTEDGDRFHDEWDCAGLRRHIRSVPISEVWELRPCSRCGKEE